MALRRNRGFIGCGGCLGTLVFGLATAASLYVGCMDTIDNDSVADDDSAYVEVVQTERPISEPDVPEVTVEPEVEEPVVIPPPTEPLPGDYSELIAQISGDNEEVLNFMNTIVPEFQKFENPSDLERDLIILTASMIAGQENPLIEFAHDYVAEGDHATASIMVVKVEVDDINQQIDIFNRRQAGSGDRYRPAEGQYWDWEEVKADRNLAYRLVTRLIQVRADRLRNDFPELRKDENRSDLLRAIASTYNAGYPQTTDAMKKCKKTAFWDYIKSMSKVAQKQTAEYVTRVSAFCRGIQAGHSLSDMISDTGLLIDHMDYTDKQKYLQLKTGFSKPNGHYTYKIEEGDNLWGLSMVAYCSVAEIEELNPGISATSLGIGQEIILPQTFELDIIRPGDCQGFLDQRYGSGNYRPLVQRKSKQGEDPKFVAGEYLSIRRTNPSNSN